MWIGEIEIDELEDKWVALIMKCSIDDGTRARPILQHSRNCCRILVLRNIKNSFKNSFKTDRVIHTNSTQKANTFDRHRHPALQDFALCVYGVSYRGLTGTRIVQGGVPPYICAGLSTRAHSPRPTHRAVAPCLRYLVEGKLSVAALPRAATVRTDTSM